MVEQGTHKPLAGGSNPPSATNFNDAAADHGLFGEPPAHEPRVSALTAFIARTAPAGFSVRGASSIVQIAAMTTAEAYWLMEVNLAGRWVMMHLTANVSDASHRLLAISAIGRPSDRRLG